MSNEKTRLRGIKMDIRWIETLLYIIIAGLIYSFLCRTSLYSRRLRKTSAWFFSPIALLVYLFPRVKHKIFITLLMRRKNLTILWRIFLTTYAYNLERLYLLIVDSLILFLNTILTNSISLFEYQALKIPIIQIPIIPIIDIFSIIFLLLDAYEIYSTLIMLNNFGEPINRYS